MTEHSRPVLRVIIASTRPGRIGLPIGMWVREQAIGHGGFDVQVTDLAELNLPFLDEPAVPSQRKYTKSHTLAWSAEVEESDGFIFVTPEYNHGYCAAIKNAVDFLYWEWAHKPVGFVSYGGQAGGMRAVQMLKPSLVAVRLSPVVESVAISAASGMIQADGTFQPSETVVRGMTPMLDEIARQIPILKQLRK